eukprot:gnl/Dysnectes_brevis/2306_a2714_1116.p1 GENE.gnl/Dysnectes_brevis/2306_a2714_1116~~gnl/Dysnectes_brevis/2306_a2714_1116.p1  ORF type:complete len:2542 (-),score=411.46 gnl/Dysnectes_brevis/2306_a2714_1116:65-7387(-)
MKYKGVDRVDKTSAAQQLFYGDISPDLLHLLRTHMDQIYLPMLRAPDNTGAWPRVLTADILRHSERFSQRVFVTAGRAAGKTLLPVPSEASRLYTQLSTDQPLSRADKEVVHELESTVLDWIRQVQRVLSSSPEDCLSEFPHPTPQVEIEFWAHKSANLRSIRAQLLAPAATEVREVLRITDSSYYPAVQQVTHEVSQQLVEAASNAAFLAPLQTLVGGLLDETDPVEALGLLQAIFRGLYLTWFYAPFYQSASRLVFFFRCLCNGLIRQMRQMADAESVLKMDPIDALDNVKGALQLAQDFQALYKHYERQISGRCDDLREGGDNGDGLSDKDAQSSAARILLSRLDDDTPKAKPSMGGEPQSQTLDSIKAHVYLKGVWPGTVSVFRRFDAFVERLRDIHKYLTICGNLTRLERLEVGGNQGTLLSTQIQQIHAAFLRKKKRLSESEYDPTDLMSEQFDADYSSFMRGWASWEKRLHSIMTAGFDECSTVGAAFGLIDSFNGILPDDTIRSIIERKYVFLIDEFSNELAKVHQLFVEQQHSPDLPANMPPVTGRIMWARILLNRAKAPFLKFEALSSVFESSPKYTVMVEKYRSLKHVLLQYQHSQHVGWADRVDTQAQTKLKEMLLRRTEQGLLMVNFDPQLVALLREVRYFLVLGLSVPAEAQKVFKRAETFRQHRAHLLLVVTWYNEVQTSLLDVERPLFAHELRQTDECLIQGLQHLNWNSMQIQNFIQKASIITKKLYDRVMAVKENQHKIEALLAKWADTPFLPQPVRSSLVLSSCLPAINGRVKAVQDEAGGILTLVEKSRETLSVAQSHPDWRDYRIWLADLIADGIVSGIRASAEHIAEGMARAEDTELAPFIEVQLTLAPPRLAFQPDLDSTTADSLHAAVSSWFDAILRVAAVIPNPAAASDDEDGFHTRLSNHPEVLRLRQELQRCVEEQAERGREYASTFKSYEDLWTCDRQQFLDRFLKWGTKATLNGKSEASWENDPEQVPQSPVLGDFDAMINRFKKQENQVGDLGTSGRFGWLAVNSRPMKQALITVISKWSFLFTQHLTSQVTSKLADLSEFIECANTTLQAEVNEGDYDSLVAAMRAIAGVKARSEVTDSMWGPLSDRVALLSRHGIQLSAESLSLLETLPESWRKVKQISYGARERLGPQEQAETQRTLGQMSRFNEKLIDFKSEFRRLGPFKYSLGVDRASEVMVEYHDKLEVLAVQAESIREKQSLFGLTVDEFQYISGMRHELVMMKSVWDVIALVFTQIESWKTTLWNDIDTDKMEEITKKFTKKIRAIDRSARSFDAFQGLDQHVKNFLKTLPLVSALRSPSMRERHWKQLMRTTKVHFVINDEFKLDDLLSLNLHKFTEDVETIVSRADKELQMERQLRELEATWKDKAFEFGLYKDGKTPTLTIEEDLMEILEDNQLTIQNMAANKYVAHFLEAITKWQHSLAAVDSVISLWLEVQQTWGYLEPIFIGSADIRAQLPDDSKRFDDVDAVWRELMAKQVNNPNIISTCSQEGLLPRLEGLQNQLAKCEKALADYLDTKCRAFPRFYFISSTDLLDILSKSQQPQLVEKHLSKIFDNIHKLEWEKDPSGETNPDGTPLFTKNAIGMYSGKREYVPFSQPCACVGPVEVWLNRLVDTMRDTLRTCLGQAIVQYLDMERRPWLEKFPAQICLTGLQIWWTTEVLTAFDKLEEGNETALKDYSKKQNAALLHLVSLVQGDLDKNMRTKISTICTIEVHARDIVTALIRDRVESSLSFAWQSQLKHRWDDQKEDCFVNICDAQFQYRHEYLGCTSRLVITPLTDRCYITLTQSLHLIMGGAPAGPAGTGKCFGKGTLVRMLDGSVKPVESVVNGDLLMGDDGSLRTVNGVTSGRGQMYRIVPKEVSAQGFTCNAPHILVCVPDTQQSFITGDESGYTVEYLTLHRATNKISTRQKRFTSSDSAVEFAETRIPSFVWEVEVQEFLTYPKSIQSKMRMVRPAQPIRYARPKAGGRTPFQSRVRAPLEAARRRGVKTADICWACGIFLATSVLAECTPSRLVFSLATLPLPVFSRLEKVAVALGDQTSLDMESGRATVEAREGQSALLVFLQALGLYHPGQEPAYTKAVTDSLHLESHSRVRQPLLAGLADGCGDFMLSGLHYGVECRLFGLPTEAHPGVLALCRSAALVAYVGQEEEIIIAGPPLYKLPCVGPAPKEFPGSVPFPCAGLGLPFAFDVTPIGEDEYFGFALDGNRRFLLADYTVVHNTETTKDLGRALGMMVYVFNCSPEMDYKSLGDVFKGLASSGAWGCFDEFNRIAVEVLSVVAMQVKCVLDAIRAKKKRFDFSGQDIMLTPSVGIFITMNPGYAGRTELPENIKALFRPISMIVPDYALITEIMLLSQGFVDARNLAKKFTTLYALNRELLSKCDHYDWGLRATIAVTRTAGMLRRVMIKPIQHKKR